MLSNILSVLRRSCVSLATFVKYSELLMNNFAFIMIYISRHFDEIRDRDVFLCAVSRTAAARAVYSAPG